MVQKRHQRSFVTQPKYGANFNECDFTYGEQ